MNIKRTIITTILALAVVAVVAPGAAQALTVQDLMTQMAQLQAQLVQLQGQQQAGNTTGVLPSVCVGVTFSRDLSYGMTGSDIKCLQALLNQLNVNVANAGAGSPGMETSYFGDATRAAVIRAQTLFSIAPASGYVGPLTRAKLNSLLSTWTTTVPPASNLPAGCTSTSGFSSTTGVSCATTSYTLPAGCTSTSGYSPLTGVSCATGVSNPPVVTLPAGCTSTAGFSPLTGVSCATGVSTQTPTVGLVGFISVDTLAPTPASDANVTAVSNIPVLGLNVKAINSDMIVNSAKVQLAVTKTAVAEFPSILVQKLYVYDGSTLLGSFPVNTSTVITTSTNAAGTAGTYYYVILSGFSFRVPVGQTKVLTISADFAPSLETDRILTTNIFDTSSVGATDGTGATRTSGTTTTRVYTVKYTSVGSSILTGTANTATPIAASVNINATSGTTDVPMLAFNVKSTVGASKIKTLALYAVGDAAALAKLSAVKLYDGATLVGSVSLAGVNTDASRTATFTDLAIDVAQDATKTLLVKANFASGVTSGNTVYLTVNPLTQITQQEPNLTTVAAVGSIITGNAMHLYSGQAAVLTFVSGTSVYSYNPTTPSSSYTTGTFVIKVRADGGTMTKPVVGNFTVLAYTNGTSVGAPSSTSISVLPNTDVPDGSEATVTINVSETRAASGTGFVNFAVTGVTWIMPVVGTVAQTWGLTDYLTPVANVQ